MEMTEYIKGFLKMRENMIFEAGGEQERQMAFSYCAGFLNASKLSGQISHHEYEFLYNDTQKLARKM